MERQLVRGRHRDASGAYADRVVDIDIILAGDLVVDTPRLTIPHRHMHERDFVVEPLLEVADKLKMDYRVTAPASVNTTVTLPASKSIATRMLIINALSGSRQQLRVSDTCDDIEVMRSALAAEGDTINVGAAGTAMRFLTAYLATRQGSTVTIDGSERMRQRPIGRLVDALRQRGAHIDYVMNEGYPPLRITGSGLDIHEVTIDGSLSSQYVTALLLIAPVTGGCTIHLAGNISSRPYIEMTLALMRQCGIDIDATASLRDITVHPGEYTLPDNAAIEADWSAASYWFGVQALLPQSSITLKGLTPRSLQGDSAIMGMCGALGVTAHWQGDDLVLCAGKSTPGHITLDMGSTPDIIPTLATTLCLLRKPFTIKGIGTLRIKESDRVAALTCELARTGYTILSPDGDSITYDGNHTRVEHPGSIATYKDHRIAMAMALASTRHSGITIREPAVVGKSYPRYWQHLVAAGFTIIPTE